MANCNWKDEKMQFCIKYKSKIEHEIILKAVRAYNTGVFKNCSSERHHVKSVRIRSYSGPYFPVFGLNTERYSVSLRIQSECG